MKLDTVPDLTMRGDDDPRARTSVRTPPTVGQLAAKVAALAAQPGAWWHLVRLEPAAAQRVVLDDADGIEVWLITWPPGHHDHGEAGVSTVVAGELVDISIAADGVTERPLRANRVRVHGTAAHQLANPGPAYAITLHARLSG